MIAGSNGVYERHLRPVRDVIGLAPGVGKAAALSMVITRKGTYFLADTYVTGERTAREIAEMTVRAAAAVRRFGVEPKMALLSHSNFGTSESDSARRMRDALPIVRALAPELEIEGEMHADAALSEELRLQLFPNSRLKGEANLLIMPSLDAAHISLNILKVLGDGLPVGPMLLGAARPAHILSPSVTARGIVNMTAVAVVDAQDVGGAELIGRGGEHLVDPAPEAKTELPEEAPQAEDLLGLAPVLVRAVADALDEGDVRRRRRADRRSALRRARQSARAAFGRAARPADRAHPPALRSRHSAGARRFRARRGGRAARHRDGRARHRRDGFRRRALRHRPAGGAAPARDPGRDLPRRCARCTRSTWRSRRTPPAA